MLNIKGVGGILGRKWGIQEGYECHDTFIFPPTVG